MTVVDTARNLSADEVTAARFLAANKTDVNGRRYTIEEFCKEILKCGVDKFYRMQRKPEFRMAVLEETMGRMSQFVPAMVEAQVSKAVKQKDTAAFMAVMRQAGLLKADRIETKQEVHNIDAALSE